MASKIIALAGRAGSGKDWVAQQFQASLDPVEFVSMIKFAQPIRDIICDMFSINSEDFDKYKNQLLPKDFTDLDNRFVGRTFRDLMLDFNCLREHISPYIYAYIAKSTIQFHQNHFPHEYVFVTDLRLKEEYEVIKSMGGHVIVVDRPRTLTDWLQTYGVEAKNYYIRPQDNTPLSSSQFNSLATKFYYDYSLPKSFMDRAFHSTEVAHLKFTADCPIFLNNRRDLGARELAAQIMRIIGHEHKNEDNYTHE
jgi:dephospho-CoA kinase